MIGGTWLLCLLINSYMFMYVCQLKYNNKLRATVFNDSALCDYVAWFGDFVKNSILVCIFMVIDILTILKVREIRLFSMNNNNKNNESISEREKRFLKQTISQGTIFLIQLITWFLIDNITSNQVVIFLLSGYAFLAIHVFDG
ncbi:hypothetical protein L5515_006727 [Caenorhabditis briggsae]|uniref:7TM GPCR serpentine receptor class x (Srx) domain-containing protein n=1 Tax=Caenorhabditis briggsae TaxID=6238 RepID=A0AAE9F189_CAEBR|nr:hypothetical protein L5515_006727 [Caenorhabditis briggsae]